VNGACTFDEAFGAIGRLDRAFPAEDVTEAQRFAELDLFRSAMPAHVVSVVNRAVGYMTRRPNLDELRQLLEDERLGRRPGRPAEKERPTSDKSVRGSPVEFPDIVVHLRTSRAVVATVRGPDGIADARWTAEFGWTCSRCPQDWRCAHCRAVEQVVQSCTTFSPHSHWATA
jgi:hypothetical protein